MVRARAFFAVWLAGRIVQGYQLPVTPVAQLQQQVLLYGSTGIPMVQCQLQYTSQFTVPRDHLDCADVNLCLAHITGIKRESYT